MGNNRIASISVFVALLCIYIYSYTSTFRDELDKHLHKGFMWDFLEPFVDYAVPLIVAYLCCLTFFHRDGSKKYFYVQIIWLGLVAARTIFIVVELWQFRESSDYYINVGILGRVYNGYKGNLYGDCYSTQSGVRLDYPYFIDGRCDTVLFRISTKDRHSCICALHPSHSDILKYMEPALFIDSVELPRPKYDGLKLSTKERDLLMCQYHLQAAKVVKKERDQFIRNLVTFQVNDTLQQTVNLMYKDEKDFEDIFESLEPGESKVTLKVSDVDPRVVKVVNWRPTDDEQEKISDEMQIDAKVLNELMHKSTQRTGVLKGRFVKNKRYYAIVSVNDSVQGKVEIVNEHDKKVFRAPDFEDGGFVLIRVSDIMPQVFTIINWHPTPEEVEKYKTPVKLTKRSDGAISLAALFCPQDSNCQLSGRKVHRLILRGTSGVGFCNQLQTFDKCIFGHWRLQCIKSVLI